MEKEINLAGQKISYFFRKSSKAKKIRLTIYGNGEVRLTVPLRVSKRVAERFVKEKSKWILSRTSSSKQAQGRLNSKEERRKYIEHKEKARQLVLERVKHFNQFYSFNFNRISIRNQKTRWGSCSGNKNLNFNYKLVFLSPELTDYIVVHELCHLKELNHSERFWKLVAETIPNYKELKRELRREGLEIS